MAGPALLLGAGALALAACGSGGSSTGKAPSTGPAALTGQAPCAARTGRTLAEASGGVGLRIYGQENHSTEISRALAQVAGYAPLVRATASNDPAATRTAVVALLLSRTHIVRIRVIRARQVLSDVGGAFVLSPQGGRLVSNGRVVGRFVLSIQDDMGYRLLVERLVGADVVMRVGARQVMSSLTPGPAAIPWRGSVRYRGVTYQAYTFYGTAFPSGRLRISLLAPGATPALARLPCADVRATVLGRIGLRAYRETIVGPNARLAVSLVKRSAPLLDAVSRGDTAAATATIRTLIAGGHVARVRVSNTAGVVADVGAPGLLAPVSGRLVGANGTEIGRFALTLQSIRGFASLAGGLTRALVFVRAGSRQLAGSVAPGPPVLPDRGPVSYRGATYTAYSFGGSAFPSGALRISLLVRRSG